ncbi:MAG: hypothetical protein ACM3O7_08790 [Acidobacteriota bacterium]
MLATVLLAAAATLPFGVWPHDTGPAATVVDDVELYLLEPEDDYSVLAVQPIVPTLARNDAAAVARLVKLARRLGADAVILLGEMPEDAIPKDVDEPLPTSGRFAGAAFIVFTGNGEEGATGAVPAHHSRWMRRSSAVRHRPTSVWHPVLDRLPGRSDAATTR